MSLRSAGKLVNRSWRIAQAAEEAGGYGYSSAVQLAVPRKLRGHPIDVIELPIGIADGYEIVSASGTKDYRSEIMSDLRELLGSGVSWKPNQPPRLRTGTDIWRRRRQLIRHT